MLAILDETSDDSVENVNQLTKELIEAIPFKIEIVKKPYVRFERDTGKIMIRLEFNIGSYSHKDLVSQLEKAGFTKFIPLSSCLKTK